MSYANDLLRTANDLAVLVPATQATLRRAVSTAYYALFHLLIAESCEAWAHPEHRGRLARQFDHKRMREASNATARRFEAASTPAEAALALVASVFAETQNRRNLCDYDLSFELSGADAADDVRQVGIAFTQWETIRTQKIAQDYLFALLFRDRS